MELLTLLEVTLMIVLERAALQVYKDRQKGRRHRTDFDIPLGKALAILSPYKACSSYLRGSQVVRAFLDPPRTRRAYHGPDSQSCQSISDPHVLSIAHQLNVEDEGMTYVKSSSDTDLQLLLK